MFSSLCFLSRCPSPFLSKIPATTNAELQAVSDNGMRGLARAGCGASLTVLRLDGDSFCLKVMTALLLFPHSHPNNADLHVSNDGLCTLAKAGCGARLTLLHLDSGGSSLGSGCSFFLFSRPCIVRKQTRRRRVACCDR